MVAIADEDERCCTVLHDSTRFMSIKPAFSATEASWGPFWPIAKIVKDKVKLYFH
jgi:hypothetical protein